MISAWHEDTAYLDASGKPAELPIEGADPSFAGLTRKYAGDLPPLALLKELRRVDAVVDEDAIA